jgi:hypothetical protein
LKKYLDDVYCFAETLSARFYNVDKLKTVLEKFNDAARGLFIVVIAVKARSVKKLDEFHIMEM